MEQINHLELYVNPAWRRKGLHSPLLIPWWGNPIDVSSVLAKQMFDAYAFDTESYAITDDLKVADMVFAPYRHNWLLRFDAALLAECVRVAHDAALPILFDGLGDVERPVDVKDTYILRYGGYRFIPEQGRIQTPLFADDLLERYAGGRLTIRKKTLGNPTVGFAGWASLAFIRRVRTLLKEVPVRLHALFDSRYRACTKGVFWREKAIRILRSSTRVQFNYHARATFSGNPKTAIGDLQQLQKEMVETILGSDYALDIRGDANDSTRLFEILSLGRIPVILDTERNFPFSDKIDYSSFAIIVDFRDLHRLPEKIAEFHKNVSPEIFERMQRNARDVYVNYFRIDAIMRPLVAELRARVANGA
jgi:hypothetical protein